MFTRIFLPFWTYNFHKKNHYKNISEIHFRSQFFLKNRKKKLRKIRIMDSKKSTNSFDTKKKVTYFVAISRSTEISIESNVKEK